MKSDMSDYSQSPPVIITPPPHTHTRKFSPWPDFTSDFPPDPSVMGCQLKTNTSSGTDLSVGVADEDHLLHHLAVGRVLGHHLPEDEQQLLDGVVLQRHHKADDVHQQRRHLLTVQDHCDGFLQRFTLQADVTLFCEQIINQYPINNFSFI